jgi:hypothetical protein
LTIQLSSYSWLTLQFIKEYLQELSEKGGVDLTSNSPTTLATKINIQFYSEAQDALFKALDD